MTITGWLNEQRQRPKIAGEYDGAESLMTAVEAGLGVAVVTARTAERFHNRAGSRFSATVQESESKVFNPWLGPHSLPESFLPTPAVP